MMTRVRYRSISISCVAVLLLLLSGCWPTVVDENEGDKNAFDEREFVDPTAPGARLHHYVMVQLEPAGLHEGDTGNEEGMDEIPYDITRTVNLGVGVWLTEQLGHRIELIDANGTLLAFADQGLASDSVTLAPGRYYIRIYHQDRGNAAKPTETLFLRATVPPTESAKAVAGNAGIRDDTVGYGWNMCEHGEVRYDSASASLWLTGDISCAYFSQADYSFRNVNFGTNTSRVRFYACSFDESKFTGTATDSTFDHCSMHYVDWNNFTLQGNSSIMSTYFNGALNNATLSGVTIGYCQFWGDSAHLDGGSYQGTSFKHCAFNNNQFFMLNFDRTNFDYAVGLLSPATGNSFHYMSYNWQGAICTHMDLRDANLASITSHWNNVNFSGSIMSGLDLSALDLDGAVFVGSQLDGASFKGNPHLVGRNFTNANLSRTDFTGATLTGAILSGVNAPSANFQNANLDQIQAQGAAFNYASFAGATLNGAVLGAASGSGKLPAKMAYTYMPDVVLLNADCRNVDFTAAHMYGSYASIQGALLTSADFNSAILSGMDFSGTTLESATFNGAQAVNCKFVGADIKNTRFDNAYLLGADFSATQAGGATFTNAAVSTGPCSNDTAHCSKCRQSTCTFDQLDPANLCCYSFSESDGTVYAVSFGATILPTDCTITCPDGTFPDPNTCSCAGDKLKPLNHGPYPPEPPCVPSPTHWCSK